MNNENGHLPAASLSGGYIVIPIVILLVGLAILGIRIYKKKKREKRIIEKVINSIRRIIVY